MKHIQKINGDLTKGGVVKQPELKAHFKDQIDVKMVDVYNTDQLKEYKVDIGELIYPNQNDC